MTQSNVRYNRKASISRKVDESKNFFESDKNIHTTNEKIEFE